MRYTEDSWWSACIGPCIGRLWLRPQNKERVSQLLNRYRGELFSGVANAAISYNVVNISLSLASMELNYQQSRAMEGEILSIMLAGMIGERFSCVSNGCGVSGVVTIGCGDASAPLVWVS